MATFVSSGVNKITVCLSKGRPSTLYVYDVGGSSNLVKCDLLTMYIELGPNPVLDES